MTPFKTLLKYLKPYRRRFIIALIGMSIFTLFSVLPPLLLRYLMDQIVEPKLWDRLLGAVALITFIPVASEVLRFFNMQLIMYTSRRFIADLRNAMYRKVMNLSLRYHGDTSAGTTVQKIMEDSNMLLRLLTGNTVRLLVDVIVFAFSITVMFSISSMLAGILLVLLIFYFFTYKIYSKRIRVSTQEYRHIFDQIAGRLQETIAGVRLVRIYNREDWENTLFLDRTSEGLGKQVATRMSTVSLGTVCTALAAFGSVIISGLGAYFVLTGSMSYGDFLAINAYVWISMAPVTNITSIAGQLSETFVSVERITELLNEKIDIQSPDNAPNMPKAKGEVEFRNVYFSYDSNNPLYRGLSLYVPAGTTVALVGPTGCGKTSLTTLLMRYWDIDDGAVLIDGTDIRSVDLKSLRQQFGVVLQDPIVFDGTLAENIAYGKHDATKDEIEEAARAAEVYQIAMRLPHRFNTVIGSEGFKLSVGEKQRVSIARAILKDPAILIMDEATSSLDTHSEMLIQKALSRVLKGRTSFVVAHRLSTITSADMIVVMEKGRIVETGRHDELMAIENGLYRQHYEELAGASLGEGE